MSDQRAIGVDRKVRKRRNTADYADLMRLNRVSKTFCAPMTVSIGAVDQFHQAAGIELF
jgi:hypothetical protein